MSVPTSDLHQRVLGWYDGHARDLPWRDPEAGAWAVLVSEIMLQQTPVARVLPAYRAWLDRWPTPAALAADPVGEAVRAWGGGVFGLWTNGNRSAVGISLVERKGEDGLCESVSQWYEASFDDDRSAPQRGREQLALDGPAQDAVLWCDGDGVRLGIGPSLAIARALVG